MSIGRENNFTSNGSVIPGMTDLCPRNSCLKRAATPSLSILHRRTACIRFCLAGYLLYCPLVSAVRRTEQPPPCMYQSRLSSSKKPRLRTMHRRWQHPPRAWQPPAGGQPPTSTPLTECTLCQCHETPPEIAPQTPSPHHAICHGMCS